MTSENPSQGVDSGEIEEEPKEETSTIRMDLSIEHTAQIGETWESIAKDYSVRLEQVECVEACERGPVEVGQELKIVQEGEYLVHLEELDVQKSGQYVHKEDGKWWAVKEWSAEGLEAFPEKNWEDHPAWDESSLGRGTRKFVNSSGQVVKMNKVEYVILHSTSSDRPESVTEKKKSQFLVFKDGTIKVLIDLQRPQDLNGGQATPHAGVSAWDNRKGLNSYSIGIEVLALEGESWTLEQFAAVKELVDWLGGYYRLEKKDILRHAQVAYSPTPDQEGFYGRGRRTDPYDGSVLWFYLMLPPNDHLLDMPTLNSEIPMDPFSKHSLPGYSAAVDLLMQREEAKPEASQ